MTNSTKKTDIERKWHLIDFDGETLGRKASDIAKLLMGKSKSYFVRNLDCGDYVVVVNAKKFVISGNKMSLKKYYRYSGYPGGLTTEGLGEMAKRRPDEVILHAVRGMLPQNKLRDKMLSRLFVFPDEQHKYADKFVNKKTTND